MAAATRQTSNARKPEASARLPASPGPKAADTAMKAAATATKERFTSARPMKESQASNSDFLTVKAIMPCGIPHY